MAIETKVDTSKVFSTDQRQRSAVQRRRQSNPRVQPYLCGWAQWPSRTASCVT